ncbi:protein GRAVITROPIC IN THE LIGHT 1-like [Rhodamnia argentea]|uniref:Protein GRAVITROPIC IN THE LIGHT 1-like n=1 Tax=Rhodamnia argentea TaxID=178133 RepID=A0A8B8QSH2_9MYRT|nr:protein GRAVITROPIC IN THE LIGHT 1-like [Rhodamnia argentea]XP_048131381.1 protein GRAVITROPIC IN THE LIGHT 1-like [Rhodamnia argentea]
MDSAQQSAVTPSKSKFAQAFAKFLHLRATTGVAPVDNFVQKIKPPDKVTNGLQEEDQNWDTLPQFDIKEKDSQQWDALEVLLAELFASISSLKAAYAHLQFSQRPCDSDGIEVADQIIVSELNNLADLKQSYVNEQLDLSLEISLLAEIKEQKSMVKTYEIMVKKLERQIKLKESEIAFLQEKLEESSWQNRLLNKSTEPNWPFSFLKNIHLSRLNHIHFDAFLKYTTESVRSFVRSMVDEMKSACWDIDAAAIAVEPGVIYQKEDHKCFAFESYVCREMFDGFQYPDFSLPKESLPQERRRQQQLFFDRFMELISSEPRDSLHENAESAFAKFCRVKYMQLIHPRMELAFCGNLSLRSQLNAGEFPETTFFAIFLEMAKRIWLLHCLGFALDHPASIFQVSRGCRFSEVFMETVAKEELLAADNRLEEYDQQVAFTVFPGFRIAGTVLHCQVYLMASKPV